MNAEGLTVGAALRGRLCLDFRAGVARDGHPYNQGLSWFGKSTRGWSIRLELPRAVSKLHRAVFHAAVSHEGKVFDVILVQAPGCLRSLSRQRV